MVAARIEGRGKERTYRNMISIKTKDTEIFSAKLCIANNTELALKNQLPN